MEIESTLSSMAGCFFIGGGERDAGRCRTNFTSQFIGKLESSMAFESGMSGSSGIVGAAGVVRRKFVSAAFFDFAFGVRFRLV